MIFENIISVNVIINLSCASDDNHIPRDDIFDYHPIRERNIYIILTICYCQRETFSIFFTNLINSKSISELVSSDKTVFLQHKCRILIRITIFFAHAQLQNSVNKEHNSNIKRDTLVEFRRIACWMSGIRYQSLLNTFRPILSH